MNTTFLFPVLIIKGKSPFYFLGSPEKLGLVSKGGDTFYNGIILIDSSGKKYKLINILAKRRASFLTTLRYFQPMVSLDLEWEYLSDLPVEGLKQVAVENITANKKYWEKKEHYADFVKQVGHCKSHTDVILLFK